MIAQSFNSKNRSSTQQSDNWMDLLIQMDIKQKEPKPILEEAPMSPDPRFNHNSKLVTGLKNVQTEEELEKERQRLRKQYLGNRAETVLFENKHGEIPQINYN